MKFPGLLVFAFIIFCHQSFGFQKDTTKNKNRNYTIFGVPTLGSAPETGFYFGAVGLLDFKPEKDSLARHSVIKTELTYTLKKQFIVATEWTISEKEAHWIVFGKNSWMRFPELFWGFGGKTKKDDDFLYDAYRLELSNSYFRKISPQGKWYWGICQQFQSIYKTKYIDSYPIEEQDIINPFSSIQAGISSGLGLGLLKDTRSTLLNPKAGEMYFSIQSLGFLPAFGSRFTFGLADLDLRFYRKTPGKGVAAFQLLSQHRTDESPYRMQGLLGGPMMLRGYYFGRYRDLNYSAAQAEYRYLPGKLFGFTVFAAAGQVYNFKSAHQAGNLKWAGGAGLRFLVDKEENSYLRMDLALTGEEDFGFYFSFGEAF